MGDPVSRVAVVGADESVVDRVRRAVRSAGGRTDDPATAEAVLAVGDEAVRDAIVGSSPGGADAPILPVRERGDAVGSASLREAVHEVIRGNALRVEQPVLSVGSDGTAHRAAFDVGFVTDEPARISEYAVDLGDRREADFRADGVVVATPLGSDHYANAAGGPLLTAGSGIAVVPIAPFTTRSNAWVVPEGVTVSVRRDAEPVSLLVDGDRRGIVTPGRPVRVEVVDRVRTLRIPDRSPPDPSTDRKGSNNS
ncbi:ATP-NAD kinase [Halorubrum sp. 48-1-W]|uniref:NAD(+)/NADH kinase n=1 Tax=Halorubrum sp. 48-1-W TaxID=2249761 RepID=UPI000DCAE95B|nr:NAD(+)/NADH kinase [Halorubrum sp. 48-1-W]RAW44942.1 ATP-NAD kinase [Halorubrum sp. 48-1-W]